MQDRDELSVTADVKLMNKHSEYILQFDGQRGARSLYPGTAIRVALDETERRARDKAFAVDIVTYPHVRQEPSALGTWWGSIGDHIALRATIPLVEPHIVASAIQAPIAIMIFQPLQYRSGWRPWFAKPYGYNWRCGGTPINPIGVSGLG